MDTDDCTPEQREAFLSKKMFLNHPLYEYIYPIENTPNLEIVLGKAGIMTQKISTSEKGEYYLKTFPINKDPLSINSYNEIKMFMDKITPVQKSNMEEFIDYCLKLVDL